MLVFCFICNKTFEKLNQVFIHLKLIEHIKEKSEIKLKCVVSVDCNSSFNTLSGLRRHAKSHFEICNNISQELPVLSNPNLNAIEIETAFEDQSSVSNENQISANLEKLQNKIKYFSAKINALGLPENVITTILVETKELAISISQVFKPLSIENNFELTFKQIENEINNTLNPYCSKYLRNKIVTNNDHFVQPIEFPIGTRWELQFIKKYNSYKRKLVQNCFQFIPITSTIKSAFKNINFARIFSQFNNSHTCSSNIYEYFCCGHLYQTLKPNFTAKHVILIQLYYDDFEIVKVLGSKTVIHKVGAIYFSVVNVPSFLKSHLDNIFLVALFYVNDLHGDFNLNSILEPIVNDIKGLEDGIQIDDLGLLQGTISSLSHDNLAANDMLGFTKSFSSKYFCRFCSLPNTETKICTEENIGSLRKADCYEILKNYPKEKKINLIDTKGIQKQPILNNLNFFNTIKNKSVDFMHDGLEGFISRFLKYIFQFFLKEKCFTNIDKINDTIAAFNFGFHENANKPSNVNLDKSNCGQNAAQILCLIKHFPFIFGRFYKNEHEPQWHCLRNLLQILTILLSFKISETQICKLEHLIKSYLEFIVNGFQRSLSPKEHLLTHYPSIIREMGPVIYMWTMRYEAKHRYFTRLKCQNFINICKTLANRHQQMIATTWLNLKFDINIRVGQKKPTQNHATYSISYLKDNFFHYKKGFFLLKNISEEVINFYEILDILESQNDYLFLVKDYIGLFEIFNNSYKLIETNTPSSIIKYKCLKYNQVFEKQFCNFKQSYFILSYDVKELPPYFLTQKS